MVLGRALAIGVVATFLLWGCDETSPPGKDPGTSNDGGVDGGDGPGKSTRDASADAGEMDRGMDAGEDAGDDGGPGVVGLTCGKPGPAAPSQYSEEVTCTCGNPLDECTVTPQGEFECRRKGAVCSQYNSCVTAQRRHYNCDTDTNTCVCDPEHLDCATAACVDDSECLQGQRCSRGGCQNIQTVGCHGAAQCGAGKVCREGTCVATQGKKAGGATCSTHDECLSDACGGYPKKCWYDCMKRSDCPNNMECFRDEYRGACVDSDFYSSDPGSADCDPDQALTLYTAYWTSGFGGQTVNQELTFRCVDVCDSPLEAGCNVFGLKSFPEDRPFVVDNFNDCDAGEFIDPDARLCFDGNCCQVDEDCAAPYTCRDGRCGRRWGVCEVGANVFSGEYECHETFIAACPDGRLSANFTYDGLCHEERVVCENEC